VSVWGEWTHLPDLEQLHFKKNCIVIPMFIYGDSISISDTCCYITVGISLGLNAFFYHMIIIM
jgi:hypothetical protein